MRAIAVINQKGGVGKTTTVFNLSYALAQQGQRVVAIDLDPQAHLTASFGMHDNNRAGIDEVLLSENCLLKRAVRVGKLLSFVPAGPRLGEMESNQKGGASRGWLLQQAIKPMDEKVDFILIDCPPSAGLLAMNALFAADELLIPVSSDFLALHGLSRLMTILSHIEKVVGKKSEKWVISTRYQKSRRLAQEVREKLRDYFPDNLLTTPIREAVALAESPSYGKSIFEYRRNSHGSEDYLSLAYDLLHKRVCGRQEGQQVH